MEVWPVRWIGGGGRLGPSTTASSRPASRMRSWVAAERSTGGSRLVSRHPPASCPSSVSGPRARFESAVVGGVLIAALRLFDLLGPGGGGRKPRRSCARGDLAGGGACAGRSASPTCFAEVSLGGCSSTGESVRRRHVFWTARVRPLRARRASSTTHISIVDTRGNAASLSSSTGCGSGVVVPGTGIQLNNMLGEIDLNPASVEGGGPRDPPHQHDGTERAALARGLGLSWSGAGSERLRGAIVQTIVNVIDHGPGASSGDRRARTHFDGEDLAEEVPGPR